MRYDGAGNWTDAEVWAGGAHLAIYANDQTYFPITGQVGTERARFASTGGIDETCMSEPFGDNLNCTGTDSSPYKFAKLQRDAESGDDHAMHRDYNSTPYRWLTPDLRNSEALSLANAQTWNLYSYSGNSPASESDPSGDAACADIVLQPSGAMGDFMGGENVFACGNTSAIAANPGSAAPPAITIRVKVTAHPEPPLDYDASLWAYSETFGFGQSMGAFSNWLVGYVNHAGENFYTGFYNLFINGKPSGTVPMALGIAAFFPGEGEADAATDGTLTVIGDITSPGSIYNLQADVSVGEFGSNLEGEGYAKSMTQDGHVQYTKGDKTFTIYQSSPRSGGVPTAQVKVGGTIISKIRLNP